MRVVIQRVTEGSVYVAEPYHYEETGPGFVILLAIKQGDTNSDVNFLADKCTNLRVFEDENGKMNNSVIDTEGEILLISQFTLYGDAQRGNRPSFSLAAPPKEAIPLYEAFIAKLRENIGYEKVKAGLFGAMMQVKIINDGPVTIIIDSKE